MGESLAGAALKARAEAIFKDAARLQPATDVGAMVRMQGHMAAARVTSTNDTMIAKMALGVKDGLNKAVPGLGDALMPIAKIPANIIYNGIVNAGPGIPMGIADIFKGRAKIQSDDLKTKYEGMAQFASGMQTFMRTVGTLAAAAFFTSLLAKTDFKTDNYGNHFVRIGNIWINMEYINAVSPALAGMMSVRKYGRNSDGVLNAAGHYTAGALQGLKSAPGVDEVEGLVTAITNTNVSRGAVKYASDFFTSRGVPSFVYNLLRDRPIDRLFFGAHGVETDAEVRHDDAVKAAHARATRAAGGR
jgi:hypothetical protein